MDHNEWLKLLDIAKRYSHENKLKLLRLDCGMFDHGGIAFFSDGKFKSCKQMIEWLKRTEPCDRNFSGISQAVCNLGHLYKNSDGLWFVYKHGAGWVGCKDSDVPFEVKEKI